MIRLLSRPYEKNLQAQSTERLWQAFRTLLASSILSSLLAFTVTNNYHYKSTRKVRPTLVASGNMA